MRTTSRFRINLPEEECAKALAIAYEFEVKKRGREIVADQSTVQHIAEAAHYLTSGEKTGIFIFGQCGNGKTTLAKAIGSIIACYCNDDPTNIDTFLKMESARDIAMYAKSIQSEFAKVKNAELLCIDDLGIEPSEVLDYGNVYNPAVDILTHRYDNMMFTICTTNLLPKQIREKYGERMADRFNEMMGRIVFNNKTYRT